MAATIELTYDKRVGITRWRCTVCMQTPDVVPGQIGARRFAAELAQDHAHVGLEPTYTDAALAAVAPALLVAVAKLSQGVIGPTGDTKAAHALSELRQILNSFGGEPAVLKEYGS